MSTQSKYNFPHPYNHDYNRWMWQRISIPVRVASAFGVVGLLLVMVGIVRGNVPFQPASVAVALLLGGGVWFLVSWAVTTAVVDVEQEEETTTEESETVKQQN